MDWFWKRKFGQKDYLMNKGLFFFLSLSFIILFVIALLSVKGSDVDNIYLSCPKSPSDKHFGSANTSMFDIVDYGICVNPFFNSSDCGGKIPSNSSFCNQEFIFPGDSLGVPPPFFVKYFWIFIVLVSVLVFGFNHLLFNKGFFKDFSKGDF